MTRGTFASCLPTPGTTHHERQGLVHSPFLRDEGDVVPVQLQYWDRVTKTEKQRSKHLNKKPYLVFSRIQHLLFLEVLIPIWLKYLQVPRTLLNLGHFFSFLVVR